MPTELETIIPGLNAPELTARQALARAAHAYLAALARGAKRLNSQTKEEIVTTYHGWCVEVRAAMREADIDNATRAPVLRLFREARPPHKPTKAALTAHGHEVFGPIMFQVGELLRYAAPLKTAKSSPQGRTWERLVLRDAVAELDGRVYGLHGDEERTFLAKLAAQRGDAVSATNLELEGIKATRAMKSLDPALRRIILKPKSRGARGGYRLK